MLQILHNWLDRTLLDAQDRSKCDFPQVMKLKKLRPSRFARSANQPAPVTPKKAPSQREKCKA